jgi:hypothetical protein
VLHDPSVFKSENIKAHLGTADVVFGMGKDKVAILKNARYDLGNPLGKGFQTLAKSRQAIGNAQVVLNVRIGVDGCELLGVTRLQTLQQVDDLPLEIVRCLVLLLLRLPDLELLILACDAPTIAVADTDRKGKVIRLGIVSNGVGLVILFASIMLVLGLG